MNSTGKRQLYRVITQRYGDADKAVHSTWLQTKFLPIIVSCAQH